MKFSVRDLLLVTVILTGCQKESNVQQIRRGMEKVDKHVKEAENAGNPIGPEKTVP
jgi:hypothetical protein